MKPVDLMRYRFMDDMGSEIYLSQARGSLKRPWLTYLSVYFRPVSRQRLAISCNVIKDTMAEDVDDEDGEAAFHHLTLL